MVCLKWIGEVMNSDKRNCPPLRCLTDSENCKKYVELLHERPTRNRKTAKEVIVFKNALVKLDKPTFFRSETNIYFWEDLVKMDDPVFEVVHRRGTRRVKDVLGSAFSIQDPSVLKFGENYLLLNQEDSYFLTPSKKVPDNAALVSIDPPVWVQFGRGKVLITRGAIWLDEDIEEHESEWLVVEKHGGEYVIISRYSKTPVANDHYPLGILKFVPGATPVGGRLSPIQCECTDDSPISSFFLPKNNSRMMRTIRKVGDKFVQEDSFDDYSSVKRRLLGEFIEDRVVYYKGGTKYYVPKYYTQGW